MAHSGTGRILIVHRRDPRPLSPEDRPLRGARTHLLLGHSEPGRRQHGLYFPPRVDRGFRGPVNHRHRRSVVSGITS